MVLTKPVSQHVSLNKIRFLDRGVDEDCWSRWKLHIGWWGSIAELWGGQGRGDGEKSCTEWILMSCF